MNLENGEWKKIASYALFSRAPSFLKTKKKEKSGKSKGEKNGDSGDTPVEEKKDKEKNGASAQ